MSALPKFTMRELLDAGVHFGHKTSRWNPQMAPYLFGSRNGLHIIDLQQTVPLLHHALKTVYEVVKNNGRVLFVGTKRQAADPVAEAAKRCGQYYVNHRWLGGMLTNWNTVSRSIKHLITLEEKLGNETEGLTKKEILELTRKKEKLDLSLGGIRDMGGKPDLVFVVDTNKEDIAIKEAVKLNIPVIAVLDSNSSPDNIDYPIPGNDDATRSIRLYCQLVSDAVLAGIQDSLSASGVDVGASEETPKELLNAAANDDAKASKAEAKAKPAAKAKAEEKAEPKADKKDDAKAEKKEEAKKPAAKKAPAKKVDAKETKDTKESKETKAAATKKAPAKKAEAKADDKKEAKKPAAKKEAAKADTKETKETKAKK